MERHLKVDWIAAFVGQYCSLKVKISQNAMPKFRVQLRSLRPEPNQKRPRQSPDNQSYAQHNKNSYCPTVNPRYRRLPGANVRRHAYLEAKNNVEDYAEFC